MTSLAELRLPPHFDRLHRGATSAATMETPSAWPTLITYAFASYPALVGTSGTGVGGSETRMGRRYDGRSRPSARSTGNSAVSTTRRSGPRCSVSPFALRVTIG